MQCTIQLVGDHCSQSETERIWCRFGFSSIVASTVQYIGCTVCTVCVYSEDTYCLMLEGFNVEDKLFFPALSGNNIHYPVCCLVVHLEIRRESIVKSHQRLCIVLRTAQLTRCHPSSVWRFCEPICFGSRGICLIQERYFDLRFPGVFFVFMEAG